jgi:hypothetical protein
VFIMLKVLQIKTVDPCQVCYKMHNVSRYFCEISGPNNGDYEYSCLLDCDVICLTDR